MKAHGSLDELLEQLGATAVIPAVAVFTLDELRVVDVRRYKIGVPFTDEWMDIMEGHGRAATEQGGNTLAVVYLSPLQRPRIVQLFVRNDAGTWNQLARA